MRIGIAISSLDGGGAEHVVRLWAHALRRLDQEVFLYGYSPEAPSDDVVKLGISDFPYRVFTGRGRLARGLGLPLWLRRQTKADALDVLFCQLPYTNLAALVGLRTARPTSTPLFICEHNVPTLLFRAGGAGASAQRALARLLYRRADGAVAVSHATATDLMCSYGMQPNRVFVLPNAIFGVSPPPSSPPERAPDGPLTVLFVGRVSGQKQPAVFVETLAALQTRVSDRSVRGVVVGTGPLEDEMRARAEDLGVALEFTGWVSDWVGTSAPYNPSCILLASHIEGLGNVLIEAAAAGIPAVAASTALGVSDAVVPGITGQLALSSTPDHLAEAILATEGLQIDPKHVAAWLERFTGDSVASRLLHILTPSPS